MLPAAFDAAAQNKTGRFGVPFFYVGHSCLSGYPGRAF
jgi:hypothetical protein